MTITNLFDEIEVLCRNNNVEHLYLIGSYASGTYTGTSDIDMMVTGLKDLGKLREEIDRIPTLKKIDIINYETCTNKEFIQSVKEHGRQIY